MFDWFLSSFNFHSYNYLIFSTTELSWGAKTTFYYISFYLGIYKAALWFKSLRIEHSIWLESLFSVKKHWHFTRIHLILKKFLERKIWNLKSSSQMLFSSFQIRNDPFFLSANITYLMEEIENISISIPTWEMERRGNEFDFIFLQSLKTVTKWELTYPI